MGHNLVRCGSRVLTMLHPPRVCCWLSALLLLVGAGIWGTLCANVTNLTCTQRSGQLFFSWDSTTEALGYNLYVSTAPIQSSQDLTGAQLRFAIRQDYSANRVLELLSKPNNESRFDRLNPPCVVRRNILEEIDGQNGQLAIPLADHRRMIVLAAQLNATRYYALTALTADGENSTITASAGGNVVGPLAERIDVATPLCIWRSSTGLAEIYLQYLNVDSFPSSDYAMPYWVGRRPDFATAQNEGCVLRLYGGTLQIKDCADSLRSTNQSVVQITPHGNNTFWYGTTRPEAPKTAYNNTQARVMSFLDFVLYRHPQYSTRLSAHRLYILGDSNGAAGALQFAFNYPGIFAAIAAGCPPTDAVNQNHYDFWHGKDDPAVRVEFIGPYSEALTSQFGGTSVRDWFNFAQMLLQNRGRDLPWLSVAHGGQDQVIEYASHGRPFHRALEQSTRGFSGGICGSCGHTPGGLDIKLTQLFRMRNDEAYPALCNSSSGPQAVLPDSIVQTSYPFNQEYLWSSSLMRVGGVLGQLDSAERFEMVIANTKQEEVVDLTIRRFARFKVLAGGRYLAINTAIANPEVVVQVDTLTPDRDGLLTFAGFRVAKGDSQKGGSRYSITPLSSVNSTIPPRISSTPARLRGTADEAYFSLNGKYLGRTLPRDGEGTGHRRGLYIVKRLEPDHLGSPYQRRIIID